MASYTTAFLGASHGSDLLSTLSKCIVVAVFTWAGLDMDIELTVTYINLWLLDIIAFSVKDVVTWRRFPIESIVFRALRYMVVLFIPLGLTMIAKSNGRQFEVMYEVLMFASCLLLLIGIVSSVATMFTRKEYQNDEFIGVALESLRSKLIHVFNWIVSKIGVK